MIRILFSAAAAAAFFALPVHADEAHHGKPAAGASQRADALYEGEVRRVDRDAKKITIRHGPLADLDMPAMTMVFQVAEPGMLEKVKPGDKVKFQAEKVGGAFKLTHIEAIQ